MYRCCEILQWTFSFVRGGQTRASNLEQNNCVEVFPQASIGKTFQRVEVPVPVDLDYGQICTVFDSYCGGLGCFKHMIMVVQRSPNLFDVPQDNVEGK